MEDSSAASASIWESMNSWCTPTVLFLFLNLMIGTILFTSNLPKHQEDQNPKQNDLNQSKLARSPSILHRLRSFNLYSHRSQPDSSPVITHNHPHLPKQESLEVAATEYVFNHPFPHEQDVVQQDSSTHPKTFDLDPTPLESFDQEPAAVTAAAESADLNHTNEVRIANAHIHLVYEPKDTVEKVTTHFEFDPEGLDENPKDLGFVEETHDEENDDQFNSLDEVYSKITGGQGHVNRTKSDTLPASGEVPVKLPAKMKKSASMKSPFSHFEEDKIVEARRPSTVKERRSAAKATETDDVEVDAKADDFINKFKHQLKLQRLDSIIRYKDMVNRGSEK